MTEEIKIESWDQIEALGGDEWLNSAERKLVEASKEGKKCTLKNEEISLEILPSQQNVVRAELLRYLILGGCKKCKVSKWGVRLEGAEVVGNLDLSFCEVSGPISFEKCRIDGDIFALQATLKVLVFSGTKLKKLNLQGSEIDGDLFLREIETCGEVNLSATLVKGQLDCTGAHFSSGEDRFSLFAQRLNVRQGFLWRNVSISSGRVNLIAARIGDLVDDATSWSSNVEHLLDGFMYSRVLGSNMSINERLDWLEKGSRRADRFCPQPFSQMAQVLTDMGYDSDARVVMCHREMLAHRDYRRQHLREIEKLSLIEKISRRCWCGLHFLFADFAVRLVVGYGHRPFRSIVALAVLIVAASVPAKLAWQEGSFAPNSGPILISSNWISTVNQSEKPSQMWSKTIPGKDWESFSPYAYAADLVVPIINLGQTEAWSPSTERGIWGERLWWSRWFFAVLGWIVTALGAAAITGIIRQH